MTIDNRPVTLICTMDVQALSSRILRFIDDSAKIACKVCRKSFPSDELIEHSLDDHYYHCYSGVHCGACEQAFFVPCQKKPPIRGVQMAEVRKIYVRMFVVHSTLCILRYNQAAANLFCETLRDSGWVNDIKNDNTSADRSLMDPGTIKSFPITPDPPKENGIKHKTNRCTSCTIM